MDISRRTFLAWSAAAGASLPLGGLERLAAAPPDVPQPIAIFSKPLQWLDYDGLADTAAEAGFDALDLTVRPGGHVLPERVASDLPRAIDAARRAGLTVPMITTAIIDADDPLTEPVLRTAADLGIGYYRLGSLDYPPDRGVAETLESYRPRFVELARVNEKYGIHGAYQNHVGTRLGSPVWDLWTLLADLDPRWIGCQYDIRHATAEGGSCWPLGLRLLADHIRTTDIKDFHWVESDGKWSPRSVPLGDGMVDFAEYFRLVKSTGIQGPTSVHFEYPPVAGDNDLPAPARRRQAVSVMKRDVERLRSMRSAAGLPA